MKFNKFYLTGLSFLTTEKGLSEAFSDYGQVVEGSLELFTPLPFSYSVGML